jgi:hypothetical protein
MAAKAQPAKPTLAATSSMPPFLPTKKEKIIKIIIGIAVRARRIVNDLEKAISERSIDPEKFRFLFARILIYKIMTSNNDDILTTGETVGIILARFSYWLWAILPAIFFLYKLGDLEPIDFVWIFVIFIVSVMICSNFKFSNLIIDLIIENKKPEKRLAILKNYGDTHFYDKTYLKLGLAYKDSGEKSSAIENFKKVAANKTATKDNKEKAKCELVKIYYSENNIEETKSWLRELWWIGDIKNESDKIEVSEIEQKLAEKDTELREKEFQLKFPYYSDVLKIRYQFTGESQNGLPHGNGKATFSNRDVYEGDFVNGRMEGAGKYTWKSSDYYIGDFKNDQRDGIGEMKYKNGDSYYGQFREDRREGEGREIIHQFFKSIPNCPNATKYEGEWKGNIKEGIGKCYDANNKLVFEGRFVKDHPVNYPITNVPILLISNFSDIFSPLDTDNNKLPTKKKAFIFYSKHDKCYIDTFKKQLKPLTYKGILDIWDDSMILPGEESNKKVISAFDNADIVFLMLSSDFLDTEFYIWEKEIKEALKRHNEGSTKIIPIKIRACDWTMMPFGKLQGLPRGDKFISNESNTDVIWLEVVQEIQELCEK